MTDTDIRPLDATTVDRIAAGEVVERPASVVKELLENALDADASRVEVAVEAGGIDGIRIADDGVGMTEADLRAAVRRHTTSKIRAIDDLEAGVSTLGFRGEALHTIGAVSRTTITSRPRTGDGVGEGTGIRSGEGAGKRGGAGSGAGTELRLEGGEVTHVGPAGRPTGTTVEVSDLFYNTPARRKYLKTERTEFARVNRVVTRYALANPDVATSLSHDGREVFATTGRGDLRSAVLSVYGREVAEAMVEVPADGGDGDGTENALADSPLDSVSGLVSHPETTRSTREYLSTFVNGRYVSEPALREAVLSAYGGQLAPDRFPFAVLFVDLPADAVDVNVHPRKMEVRFENEAAVREAVTATVRDALLSAGLLRASAPRGRSAPGDARIEPESDSRSVRGAEAGTGESADATAGEPTDGKPTAAKPTDGKPPASEPPASEPTASDRTAGESDEFDGVGTSPAEAADRPFPADPERKFRPAGANARLPGTGDGQDAAAEPSGEGDPDAIRSFDRLPPLRVLGQVGETYVVAESPDGLVVVDQHAADERVNYERLAAGLADAGTASQRLVRPAALELTAGEAAVFEASLDDLRSLGFEAALDDDGRSAVVTAVPAALGDALDPELLRDVLSEVVAADGGAGEGGASDGVAGDGAVASAADALVADLACYPSVTAGTSLSEGSVVDLLVALDECENPFACPHGRPTVIEVSAGELADRFERDYPGHATRRPEG